MFYNMKSINKYIFEGSIEFPEEISKLTSRSSDVDFDNAIMSVLALSGKTDDSDNIGAINQFKQIVSQRFHKIKYLSKKDLIEKIKEQYKENIKNAEKKKKLDDHNNYLKSEKGVARQAEFDKKMKSFEDDNEKLHKEIDDETISGIKSILPKVDKVFLHDYDYMTMDIGKARIELSFTAQSYRNPKPVYKVLTTSYGYIEPDTDEAYATDAVAQLLNNKKLIDLIKSSANKFRETYRKQIKAMNKVRKEYKDLFLDLNAELDYEGEW